MSTSHLAMHVFESRKTRDLAVDGHHVRPPGVTEGSGCGASSEDQLLDQRGLDVIWIEGMVLGH